MKDWDARSPKYDKADSYTSQKCGKIAKFSDPDDHFGPTSIEDSKNRAAGGTYAQRSANAKFRFAKAIRHHLWTSLARFLPSRSPVSEIPGAVNLGGGEVKISIHLALRSGLAGNREFCQFRRELSRTVVENSVKWADISLIPNHGRGGISRFAMIRGRKVGIGGSGTRPDIPNIRQVVHLDGRDVEISQPR